MKTRLLLLIFSLALGGCSGDGGGSSESTPTRTNTDEVAPNYDLDQDTDFTTALERKQQTLVIEPALYQNRPVVGDPATICLIAGYQVAVSFETEPARKSETYYSVEGIRGESGMSFILQSTSENVVYISKVTCKVPIF